MPSILLVEDDGNLSNAYTLVLTKLGYTVHQAQDAQQGLLLAAQVQPDIIVADMLMPGMSGLDFLRELNLPSTMPQTKLIVLSNVESPKIIEEAKQLGASRYLLKIDHTPYELEKLIREIAPSKGNPTPPAMPE
jgi:CheY-like chemotaxis protein